MKTIFTLTAPLCAALLMAPHFVCAAPAPIQTAATAKADMKPLSITQGLTTDKVAGPAWSQTGAIYEISVPQQTREGTFAALTARLPEIKKLGVKTLWLMPIHPRGVENRKGEKGSPYSVIDHYAVNPNYGTKDDFIAFVKAAHELGFRVIIDWAARYTAWDHPLITGHSDWYRKNPDGTMATPTKAWWDVAQLDYSNRDLWNWMRDAMQFWVRETDIDGFRVDVAHMYPVEFWQWVRPQLEQIKPLLMVGEAGDGNWHPIFDVTYDWNLPPVLWDIAAGRQPASAIDEVLREEVKEFPAGAVRMRYTGNHDFHRGLLPGRYRTTVADEIRRKPLYQRYGGGLKAFTVLQATLPGRPLLYNGQETGWNLNKGVNWDDPIGWKASSEWQPFYQKLLGLYKDHRALQCGDFVKIPSSNDAAIYAFARGRDADKIVVVLNLSDKPQSFGLQSEAMAGSYAEAFSGETKTLAARETMQLGAWEYRVYVGA